MQGVLGHLGRRTRTGDTALMYEGGGPAFCSFEGFENEIAQMLDSSFSMVESTCNRHAELPIE